MTASRRNALKALGVTVAAATLGGFESMARAAVQGKSGSGRVAVDVLENLRGTKFNTCTVQEVGALEHGCVPVAFVDTRGKAFVVDVLRHDPSLPGVAQAGALGVYMKVGRRGATREEHGLAAMALAAELARRQKAGARLPDGLLTLSERAAVRTEWNRRELAEI